GGASGPMMRVPRPSMRGNPALAYDYDVDPEPELLEIPAEQRKTLLQLTEKTCRWPVGDPGSTDFFFCGGDTANDLPYFSYHSRGAYQPLNDRRGDKREVRDSAATVCSLRGLTPSLTAARVSRPSVFGLRRAPAFFERRVDLLAAVADALDDIADRIRADAVLPRNVIDFVCHFRRLW